MRLLSPAVVTADVGRRTAMHRGLVMLVTRWIEDGADDGCNEIAAIRIGRHSVASVSGRSRGPSDLHDGRPRDVDKRPRSESQRRP